MLYACIFAFWTLYWEWGFQCVSCVLNRARKGPMEKSNSCACLVDSKRRIVRMLLASDCIVSTLRSSHRNQLWLFAFLVVAFKYATWKLLFKEETKEYLEMRCNCVILRRVVCQWVSEQWMEICSKSSQKLLIGLSLSTVELEQAWVSQIRRFFLCFEPSGLKQPLKRNTQHSWVSSVLS